MRKYQTKIFATETNKVFLPTSFEENATLPIWITMDKSKYDIDRNPNTPTENKNPIQLLSQLQ